MAHLRVLSLVALLVVADVARAADDDAGTGPRAAMKALFEAIEAADAAAVRTQFNAPTPEEKALAEAYADQITAAKSLGEAAKAKFGPTGDPLTKGMPMKDAIAQLDKADVSVTGNQATVKLPGQPRSVRLTKVEGKWRVDLADYAGATPENIAGQTAVLKDMAQALRSIATDIAADKFISPADAQRALNQKLQGVLFNTLQKHPPTSRPVAKP
ncbi:MAG: hypothetical protein ACAI43_06200 [Phycisphaerae bacterium]